MNEELQEILESYKLAIEALVERINSQDELIKTLTDKCESLEHLLFEEIINPAKQAMDEEIYNSGLQDFTNKYGDKLAGYNDKLRSIEGADFDIVKQAYDGYEGIEGEKPDEEVYIEELVKSVDAQLDEIRSALGAAPDAEVTITDTGDGEPEIKVEDQEVEATGEAAPESEEVVSEDEEEESDPEELAKLEEELLNYKG